MAGNELPQVLVGHPVMDGDAVEAGHLRVERGPVLPVADDCEGDLLAVELPDRPGHGPGAVEGYEGAVEQHRQRAALWRRSDGEVPRLRRHRDGSELAGREAELTGGEVDLRSGVE